MMLNFREQGEGPPVVILHGLFGSLENWAYVAQQLAPEFRVFSVDQRNHGRSPHHDEMSFPVLAADLATFLDHHDLERVHVLGHSMGGKAAMEFALQFPERVERLVVVDIAPRAYGQRHDGIFRALLGLKLEQFSTRGEVEAALEPEIPDLSVRRFLVKGLAQHAPGTLSWRFNLRVLHERYAELNKALDGGRSCNAPAFFVRGAESDYVEDKDWPQIRQLFPRAELETIASASHWLHAEQAEIFIKHIREFLGRNF